MRKYFFKSNSLLLSNILAITLSSIVSIYMAFILRSITDISYSGEFVKLKEVIFIMLGYSFLVFITGFSKRILRRKLLKNIMYNVKKDMFNSIISKNISSFTSSNTANYISALSNDATLIEQDYFSSLIDNFNDMVTFIFGTYAIFKLNFYVAIAILATGFIPIFIPILFQKELGNRKKSYSDGLGSFTTKIKDIFTGFEVIKSFNIEDKIKNDFDASNDSLEIKKYKSGLFESLVNSISEFFGFIMFFVPLGLGTYLALQGNFTGGGMIASVQLTNHVVNPLVNLSNIIGKIKAIKPINEKIEKIISENDGSDIGTIKNNFKNNIEFKNISFSYNEDRQIVDDVSFSINKGEKIAIVGKSGSGKSTLLRLLLRYYDNYDGNIKMDNMNIKDIKLSSMYELISIIQQNVFMFDDSIESNIALYGNYSDEEVDNAIKLSGLQGLIDNLPQGKNSPVGENGNNLSGGEKQRISIARALIKNTPIILLDEATASLDAKTAYDIEDSLLSIDDLTSIVITHKLNEELLARYDKIIVMDKGSIIEIGNFNELMENRMYFYSLFNVEKAA